MSILSLPPEILQDILDRLDSQSDVVAFLQVHTLIDNLFTHYLYFKYAIDPTKEDGLFWAAEFGHQTTVRKYLSSGAKVEIRRRNVTPLSLASKNGHTSVVRLLLMAGAKDGKGNAFQWAVNSGHEGTAQLLFSRLSGEKNYIHKTGLFLHLAASRGLSNVVQQLLDHHVNVNVRRGEFGSAMQAASAHGQLEVVRVLLHHSADINRAGRYRSALVAAAANDHTDIVQLLLSHADSITDSRSFGAALCYASALGNFDIVQMLLDRHDDVNAPGDGFENALGAACSKDQAKMARYLIDRGAKFDTNAPSHRNLLVKAAAGSHEHILHVILDHGFGTKAQNSPTVNHFGTVPKNEVKHAQCQEALKMAAMFGDARVVQILLDQDVNYTAEDLGVALLFAAASRSRVSMRVLLDRGATVNTPDIQTGLNEVIREKHAFKIEVLTQPDIDIDTAVGRGRSIIRDLYYASGPRFNQTLYNRVTEILIFLIGHDPNISSSMIHGA